MIILQSTKVNMNTSFFPVCQLKKMREDQVRLILGLSPQKPKMPKSAKNLFKGGQKCQKTSHHPITQKTCHFPAHNVTEKGELQINGGGNS